MDRKIHLDTRLVRLSAICLALPESERWYNGQHARFQVRKRTFAYYLDDHQGNGMVSVECKAPAGESDFLIGSEPLRFYRPAYLGSKGWVGMRLDIGEADWAETAELVVASYLLVAPKRLASAVEHRRRSL